MSALAELSAGAEEVRLFSGETVLRQGRPADSLYIVVTGSVELQEEIANGETRTVGEVPPGSIFGEVPFLDQGLSDVSAQTREDCTLIKVRYECLTKLANAHPETAIRITRGLARAVCRKLRGSEIQIADLKFVRPTEVTRNTITALRRAA